MMADKAMIRAATSGMTEKEKTKVIGNFKSPFSQAGGYDSDPFKGTTQAGGYDPSKANPMGFEIPEPTLGEKDRIVLPDLKNVPWHLWLSFGSMVFGVIIATYLVWMMGAIRIG